VRADPGRRGVIVSIDAKDRIADRDLASEGEIDLGDAVGSEPCSVGAPCVTNVHPSIATPELEMYAADARILDDEVVRGVSTDGGRDPLHCQCPPSAGAGYRRDPGDELTRLDGQAFVHHGVIANAFVAHAWYPINVGRQRTLVACAFMMVCFVHPRISLGQPTPADELATGRRLFAEALDDEDHRRFSAALDKYRRVLQIRDTTAIRYRMGISFEALGKITQAVEAYGAAVRLGTANATDAELVRASQARLDALEPKVAHLAIRVSPSAGSDADVRVDDAPIQSDATRDIRLDPGPHVVTVTASGGRTSRAEVVLSEGGRAEIPITLESSPPTDVRRGGSSLRTIAVVTGAAGGVLAAAGLVVLALRSSAISELEEACPQGNCPASREQDLRATRDRAVMQGPLGGALIGAGALAIGAGIVLFTLGRDETKNGMRVVPGATTSGLTLTVAKAF
jgi:hypothetical protein